MAAQERTITYNVVGNSTRAQKAFADAAKAADASSKAAAKASKEAADKIATAQQEAAGRAKKAFSSTFSAIGNAYGSAFGPIFDNLSLLGGAFDGAAEKGHRLSKMVTGIGVSAAGVGGALTVFGSADKQAFDQLSQAITNTGGDISTYKSQIDEAVKRQAKFGHTAGETYNALQTLTQASGSPTKALKMMGLAADLAAAKHESLTSASDQLAKILVGKGGKALSSFGITMSKTGSTSDKAKLALAQLSAKIDGQASASANNFGGRMRAMRAEVENAAASFGQKWGPAITAGGVGVSALGSAMSGASAIMSKFKTAQEASTVATEGMTAAETEMDAAASANPIGLIVIALAALVGGLVYAYKHVKWFHDFVQTAFHAIGAVGTWLWNNALKPIFTVIEYYVRDVLMPEFRFFADVVQVAFKVVAAIGTWLWNNMLKPTWAHMQDGLHILGGVFTTIGGVITGIWNGIGDAISYVWDNVIKPIWDNIKHLIDDVGSLGKALGHLPGGGLLKSLPGVGSLFKAAGGPVMSNRPYIVGEAGPEWFVPHTSGTIMPHGTAPAGTSTSSTSVTVYAATNADPHAIGREVAWQLRSMGSAA